MTTQTQRSRKFELTFWGLTPKRYRRWHTSFASAEQTALEILADIDNRAAHPANVYGPGLGKDGVTIN